MHKLLNLLILPLSTSTVSALAVPVTPQLSGALPKTPRNPHFTSGQLNPWLPFTASGAGNLVKITSPGNNGSPYCTLLFASSTRKIGGYASLNQDFAPRNGVTYSVSFAYKQTLPPRTLNRDKAEVEAAYGRSVAAAEAGSITFGVLDHTIESYLFAETITMYPSSSGMNDSLGNKQGVWHRVQAGTFTGNMDAVTFQVVLEPAAVGKKLAVEVDDLVVRAME